MQNQMKNKLIETINYEMQQIGNEDVQIENIRFFISNNYQCALADVSYKWWLNAWNKQVVHKDVLFVLVDNKWQSPIFG